MLTARGLKVIKNNVNKNTEYKSEFSENYRPISNLTVLSKLLEKLVHKNIAHNSYTIQRNYHLTFC